MTKIWPDNYSERCINTWIFRPKPQPHAHIRLFCFPYAGGALEPYCHWPQSMPTDIEICAIRLPGRVSRFKEPPYRRIFQLVKDLVNILKPFFDKPFAFFGHSMGAKICFELARQLRTKALPTPKHLYVSGCRAPHIPYPHKKKYQLGDRDFIDSLKRFNGLPIELLRQPDFLQIFIPTLRADIEMYETYIYNKEEPLECPISSFGGLNDTNISYEEIAAWGEHTYNNFELHLMPGDHFFINDSQMQLSHIISKDK